MLGAMATSLCMSEEDRTEWIDPDDMLNYDPSTGTMLKKKQVGV